MANDKRQQKKAQQQRKKRELAKKEQRKRDVVRSSPVLAVRSMRPDAPFGPAYVSAALAVDAGMPPLVQVIVGRKIAGIGLLYGCFMVDRTCLGVKDGFVFEPARLAGFLEKMAQNGDPMNEVEPLLAQSVVFHAIDYARKLGFSPHADAPVGLLEPRPATLLDTPLASAPKPIFVNGPYDNEAAILAQLTRVCGPGNFEFLMGGGLGPGLLRGLEVADDDDDDDGDEDAIDTEGSDVP
jgi:hypothetical protein